MDPMAVEEDRDAVTAFFRAQPLYFDGTRRTVGISVWLHDMEQIFMLCHIEHHLRVRLAVRCLYGAARLWWIETGEREVPARTWTQFFGVIRGRYGPLVLRRGLGAPDRDPEFYRVMRHSRYQLLSHAWQAYPGEPMVHYGWRFREEMLPLIPRDLPDADMEALTLLRNGVPMQIRQHVPIPSPDKGIFAVIDDILQAEATVAEVEAERQATQDRPAQQDEAGPSEPRRDEAGPSTPQYEVGPLQEEEEEEEPRYEVGPLLEEEPPAPAQEAEDPPTDDEDVMQIDAPEDPPIPLIIISSDDEDEDEDPEEFPEEEEDDFEDEPFEIVPDEGDDHADEESDSDVSALSIDLVF